MVVKKVRKTGIRMERGRILWRRVQSEGVLAGVKAGTRIGAWVNILSCRIRIRVTVMVLVGANVLLELARLPLIGGEIRNALGAPGVGRASW